ncbi:MAG: hypothetical protein J6P16_01940 [Eubacterium sp.]|nr:hypothetical protein [Eubacterium sp.]
MNNRKIAKRSLAIAMAFAMTAGVITVDAPEASAAVKPTVAKSTTVTVGALKKLSISNNGFKIKDVDADSADDDIADVDASKKTLFITGKSAGKTKIITTIKGKNKKNKTKTYKLKTTVTVKAKSTPVPTTAPTQAPTVTTLTDQLNEAAAAGKTSFTIGADQTGSIVIPQGTYKNMDLVINASNATGVGNYATFKSITVNGLKNAFSEYASDNNITINTANAINVTINAGANTSSLTFVGTTAQNHAVEVKGNVKTMTVGTNARAALSVVQSGVVTSLTSQAGSKTSIILNGNGNIATTYTTGDPIVYMSGSTTKLGVVDVKSANTNARVYIDNTVVSQINSVETVSAATIIQNRTNANINNLVTRSNNTTYSTVISPIVTSATAINIGVYYAKEGDDDVEFTLQSPSGLNLATTNFNFYVRSGSVSGTIMNSNRRVTSLGYQNYRISLDNNLTSGTYYITLSTSLNYALSRTSFTVGSGSGAPALNQNGLSMGSTIGTTKITGIDTTALEYYVDNNPTGKSNYTRFTAVNTAKEIKIQTDQWIHIRRMNVGSQPASAITNVQVTDQNKIKGEAQRIAAASGIGSVVSEANQNGNFTLSNVKSSQRWYAIDGLIDFAVDKLGDYINVGAGDAELKALPNASTFNNLVSQFADTSTKLILSVNISGGEYTYYASSSNYSSIVSELSKEKAGPFQVTTGAGEKFGIKVTGWACNYFDDTPGEINSFYISKWSPTGQSYSGYVLADDIDIYISVVNAD